MSMYYTIPQWGYEDFEDEKEIDLGPEVKIEEPKTLNMYTAFEIMHVQNGTKDGKPCAKSSL